MYTVNANLGNPADPIEYSNQWHTMGEFESRRLAEQALANIIARKECKAAFISGSNNDAD